MGRKEHHVVSNPDGGWDVKRENAERASRHCETKDQAVEVAREIAKNQESELIIHRQDGTIQDSRSYGNDPCPPKDKR